MPSVIFICTANRCRSPMAAGLLRRLVAEQGAGDQWQITSAGTWAAPDLPAMSLARSVCETKGADLHAHRSRLLTAEILQAADVILVMTRFHLEAVRAEFPQLADRLFLLSELIGQRFDIADPINGTLDDYRRSADDIEHILIAGLPRLIELTERHGRKSIDKVNA